MLKRFWFVQAAGREVSVLNGVIIVGKRWSCRRRPRADSWSLSTDTKLLLMRTTAGDLFSPVLQQSHTNTHTQTDKQIHSHLHSRTHTHTHRGGKHFRTQRSEQSRNLWRKTGSRHKTVKYITVVRSLLWKVWSLQNMKIILIFTSDSGLCQTDSAGVSAHLESWGRLFYRPWFSFRFNFPT